MDLKLHRACGVLVRDAQQLPFMVLNLSPTQHFVVLKCPFSYRPQRYCKANSGCQTYTIQYGGDTHGQCPGFCYFSQFPGIKRRQWSKYSAMTKMHNALLGLGHLFLLNFLV